MGNPQINTTPDYGDQLDALRSEWQSLSEDLSRRFDRQTSEIENLITRGKIKSDRDKLLRITLIPNVFAILGILAVQIFSHTHPALMICATLYFVIMAAVRCFKAYKIKQLDPYTDTIRNTLQKVVEIKRLQSVGIMIGLSLAIPLIIWMFIVMTADYGIWALYGGIAGLLLGGFCGWMICRHTIELTRRLAEQLKES